MPINGQRFSDPKDFVFTSPSNPLFRQTRNCVGSMERLIGSAGKRLPSGVTKLNSVFHTVEQCEPQAYPYVGGGFFIPNMLPSREGNNGGTLAFWEIQKVKDAMLSLEYSELNKLEKSLRPLDTSFSLLNFLNELRELPTLLDPFKVAKKRLAVPSTRKVKKAPVPKRLRSKIRGQYVDSAIRDFGDTFVNGQFGYVPTISDAQELHKRFSTLESSFSKLKEKLKPKSFKRFKELHMSFYQDVEGANGFKYRIFWKVSGLLRIRGKSTREVPLLNQVGPLLSVLEQGGVRLNLGVIWNAIPFSWAVDWFVPVGDFLENVGQRDALGIQTRVRGSYSWKLQAYATVYPHDVESTHPNAQEELPGFTRNIFYANVRFYHRRTLPESLDPYIMPPFKTNNNWSLTKAGIASAIANGFRRR